MTIATDVVPGSIITVNGVPSVVASVQGNVITVVASPAASYGGKSGQPLVSSGTAAPPQFSGSGAGAATPVGSGGTGATTLTAHGVVVGEGTSAVAITSAGTAGQVLTSGGASADPTFQGIVLQRATVTLTSVQLLALKATPVSIIAAPGAGKALHVIGVSLKYNFVATAYTLNAGTFRLFQGLVATNIPLFADVATGLLDQSASTDIVGIPALASGAGTVAHLENVAVTAANDGAAEFTLGDGTLDVIVLYAVLTM